MIKDNIAAGQCGGAARPNDHTSLTDVMRRYSCLLVRVDEVRLMAEAAVEKLIGFNGGPQAEDATPRPSPAGVVPMLHESLDELSSQVDRLSSAIAAILRSLP